MEVCNVFEMHRSDREPGEGEHLENGLIHCDVCGEPLETVVRNPFSGHDIKVRCMCSCRQKEQEAEEERLRAEERARRAERMRRRCFGDLDCSGDVFERDDCKEPQNSRRVRAYAERFADLAPRGMGLLLFGKTGTGKTFHARCVANALVDRGYSVVMESVPSLLRKVQRSTFDAHDVMSDCLGADLLILDDLGAERGTEYAQEQVYSLVDGRYAAKRPMLVSTNLEPRALTEAHDVTAARIYSRILERCLPLRYSGMDRRTDGSALVEMASMLDRS